jgi:hypothetical protein
VSAWKSTELARLGSAEEVQIVPLGHDHKLGRSVTVWAVSHGDALFIRSAVKGREAAWFKAVQKNPVGRIRGGGVQVDVKFENADPEVESAIDAAYRAKYRGYAGRILNSVLTPEARSTTIKISPR